MKILVINGPNLNMLGRRNPELYGKRDFAALCDFIRAQADALGMDTELFQSNHEGEIIDAIQSAAELYDGIVINAGGYTHTSVAIADAIEAAQKPAIEVHLTDVNAREEFRKVSYLRKYCAATYSGHGFDSYRMALEHLHGMLK